MAHHSRSNSLPSTKSHPTIENLEIDLSRLKSSEATSSSICKNLESIQDLHKGINDLIQLPSIRQALSHEQGRNFAHELLDGSLRLLDSCEIAKDVIVVVKDSIQEFESSIRRNRGETVISHEVDACMASRKKINKMVKKCIKSLKGVEQISPIATLDTEYDLKTIMGTLREAETIGFSILKSVSILLSGSKSRKWSMVSKFTTNSRWVNFENILNIQTWPKVIDAASVPDLLKQLKASEMTIKEIEEGLEAFFRSLVKMRVSLLNILSH